MAKLKENSTIVKASGEELIATEPKVLSMIQDNAYVHPATHPASMITGLANVATSGDYEDLLNKPATLPPGPHDHDDLYEPKNANIQAHIADTTSNPHKVTKEQIGLGNVDNTSDLDKPISRAVQQALDTKVDNSRVLTDVPANAEFTDTIYTHPETHPASMITGLAPVAISGSYNDLVDKPDIVAGPKITVGASEPVVEDMEEGEIYFQYTLQGES